MTRVTFINPLSVPAAREDEFLAKWDRGAVGQGFTLTQRRADYVREREGFVSTSLHRSLDQNSRFQYFTVAVWESADHFYPAIGSDWWREYVSEFGFGPGPEDFAAHPTLCEQGTGVSDGGVRSPATIRELPFAPVPQGWGRSSRTRPAERRRRSKWHHELAGYGRIACGTSEQAVG